MAATPYEILTFVGRSDSGLSYDRLKAATGCNPPPSSPRSASRRAAAAPLLLDQRMERAARRDRRPLGIELILPDWFYAGVLDDALILTIDRAYFDLTGGLERWLYRLVRKHGGRQTHGWSFDLPHLHLKSGSLSPLRRFRFELRAIVQRQPLPGYHLTLIDDPDGRQRLIFRPTESDCAVTPRGQGGVR
jgi:plasmid replication initiation protein